MSRPDQDDRRPLPSIEAFEKELMRAAQRSSRPWFSRRAAGMVAALAVAIPVGIASAGQLPFGEDKKPDRPYPAVVISEGQTVVTGFIDPRTDQTIRCADGELLTQETAWATASAAEDYDPIPTCADGSTPKAYMELRAKSEEWMREQEAQPEPKRITPETLPTFEDDPGAEAFVIERVPSGD